MTHVDCSVLGHFALSKKGHQHSFRAHFLRGTALVCSLCAIQRQLYQHKLSVLRNVSATATDRHRLLQDPSASFLPGSDSEWLSSKGQQHSAKCTSTADNHSRARSATKRRQRDMQARHSRRSKSNQIRHPCQMSRPSQPDYPPSRLQAQYQLRQHGHGRHVHRSLSDDEAGRPRQPSPQALVVSPNPSNSFNGEPPQPWIAKSLPTAPSW
jgi:hypothetical protein